jgi:hypothetical protein
MNVKSLLSFCLGLVIASSYTAAFMIPQRVESGSSLIKLFSSSTSSMTSEKPSAEFMNTRGSDIQMGTETLIIPMMDDTRIKIRFHPSQFQELATKTNELVSSFKALQTAEKMGKVGHKEPEMEFRHRSENNGDVTKFEIECNPNIYPDALHAKLFLKVSTNSLEVTSECMVTAMIDALKGYKATYNLKLEKSN